MNMRPHQQEQSCINISQALLKQQGKSLTSPLSESCMNEPLSPTTDTDRTFVIRFLPPLLLASARHPCQTPAQVNRCFCGSVKSRWQGGAARESAPRRDGEGVRCGRTAAPRCALLISQPVVCLCAPRRLRVSMRERERVYRQIKSRSLLPVLAVTLLLSAHI